MVSERFCLVNPPVLPPPVFGFGAFGEVTYLRTYARVKEDGTPEGWADTVQRVVEGTLSIRKHWYKLQGLPWNELRWQVIGQEMYKAIYEMHFLPAGRGLWAMGTEHVYNIGSLALNNCAYTEVKKETWINDLCWSMDAMMLGAGVGYGLLEDFEVVFPPEKKDEKVICILPDTREGWVESVRILFENALLGIPTEMDYGLIRKAGTPIKGFGGTSSGPEPLRVLHERLKGFIRSRREVGTQEGKPCSTLRFLADSINAIGVCVVSGNVRRGAQILLCPAGYAHRKNEFLGLKSGGTGKERADIGYLSNNSLILSQKEDFLLLPEIVEKVLENGEPGILNAINIRKFGRFGHLRESVDDAATGCNPCGEIPLENKELCNLVELFPTRINRGGNIERTVALATLYAQTVSLLPTHQPETNAVVARNRRIGVSISGVAEWLAEIGGAALTRELRELYDRVRFCADQWARESGVVSPVRCTTIKPSGTISLLAGVSSGMHFPTFRYAIRRIRISETSDIAERLCREGVPYEKDVYTPGTLVFEFPIASEVSRPANEVSIWEQMALLSAIQREWADNMVSCTGYFDKGTEGRQLEHMLGLFAPLVKSVSLLPHSDVGAYAQMPYEGISPEEYSKRKASLPVIDWKGTMGQGKAQEEELYCTGDTCKI